MNPVVNSPIATWNNQTLLPEHPIYWDRIRYLIFFLKNYPNPELQKLANRSCISEIHINAVYGQLRDHEINQLKSSKFQSTPALFLLAERTNFVGLNLLEIIGPQLPDRPSRNTTSPQYSTENLADRAAALGNIPLLEELIHIFPDLIDSWKFRHLLHHSMRNNQNETAQFLINFQVQERNTFVLSKAISFFTDFVSCVCFDNDPHFFFNNEGAIVQNMVLPIIESLENNRYEEYLLQCNLENCCKFFCLTTYKTAEHGSWKMLALSTENTPIARLYALFSQKYEETKNALLHKLDAKKTLTLEEITEKLECLLPILDQCCYLPKSTKLIQFTQEGLFPRLEQDFLLEEMEDLVALNRSIDFLNRLTDIISFNTSMERRERFIEFYTKLDQFIKRTSKQLANKKEIFSTSIIKYFLANQEREPRRLEELYKPLEDEIKRRTLQEQFGLK